MCKAKSYRFSIFLIAWMSQSDMKYSIKSHVCVIVRRLSSQTAIYEKAMLIFRQHINLDSVVDQTKPNLPNTEASVRYYSVRFGSVRSRNTKPNLYNYFLTFFQVFWHFLKVFLTFLCKFLDCFRKYLFLSQKYARKNTKTLKNCQIKM